MKNKKVLLSLGFIFSIALFFIIRSSDSITIANKNGLWPTKMPLSAQHNSINSSSNRSIASVANKSKNIGKIKQHKGRDIIGHIDDINKLKFNNQVSKDWKKHYQHNFKRMAYGQKYTDFKIEKKRSVIKVKNNIARNLEHITVSYKRQDGSPFSFEALVDSQTGTMVQSWNKARYEFKKPVQINATNYLYKND